MEVGGHNTFRVSKEAKDHRRAKEKELSLKTTWLIASWSPRETRRSGAAQSQSRALRMNCQRNEPIRSFWSLGWTDWIKRRVPAKIFYEVSSVGSRTSHGLA